MPGPEHRIVVLTGKELFLRTQYTSMLKDKLEAEHGEIEVFRFDGDSVDLADVLDECRSFGLMAGHKMVVVDDADQFVNAQTRPMLDRYANNPAEAATLVLRSGKWNSGKLDDSINKVGLILKCDTIDEDTACRWVLRRAQKEHGSSIDARAATALVERLGADLGRIDTELGKLSTAAGQGQPITTELISELVGLTREEEVWAIQSCLLCGNASRAIGELRLILGNAPKSNAVPVVFACSDLARKLMGASEALAQGGNANTVSRELKMWGPSRDSILHAARRIGPQRARALFDECVKADVLSKSSSIDTTILLERLTLSFVEASRR